MRSNSALAGITRPWPPLALAHVLGSSRRWATATSAGTGSAGLGVWTAAWSRSQGSHGRTQPGWVTVPHVSVQGSLALPG
jgi:hypothetical protein